MQVDDEPSGPLILIVVVLACVGLAITLITAPFEHLLGESAYAVESAIHGLMAGLFMITVTIGLFQGYRLFTGHIRSVGQLQIGSVVNATMAFLTIFFGNRIYIPYRAPGGPRTYFLEHLPEVHKIFFEFKEFIALFTLPLTVLAAYLFIRYQEEILERKDLRTLTAIVLALVFFYFVVAFALGAAITKLKAV